MIVGLPGSGKTHLARTLADRPDATLIDDISLHLGAIEAFKAQPTARLIITDPTACLNSRADIVSKLTEWFGVAAITFLAFENDLDACMRNIKLRSDDRTISEAYLRTLARNYDPKKFGPVFPVYSANSCQP